MAVITEKTIWHAAYKAKFLELAKKIGTTDEIIYFALKGIFKEYLFLTSKQVYIIKEGIMTGNMFGSGMFSLPFSQVATTEIKMNFGGNGFLEISASGMNATAKSYWSNDSKSDPSKASNCICISKNQTKDFQNVINKINELRAPVNVVPNNAATSSSLDEIKKLKELLDIDAITQTEYDEKKKKLLGL